MFLCLFLVHDTWYWHPCIWPEWSGQFTYLVRLRMDLAVINPVWHCTSVAGVCNAVYSCSVLETSPARRLFRPRGRNWLMISALSSANYVLPSRPTTFHTYLFCLILIPHRRCQFLYRLLQCVKTLTFISHFAFKKHT